MCELGAMQGIKTKAQMRQEQLDRIEEKLDKIIYLVDHNGLGFDYYKRSKQHRKNVENLKNWSPSQSSR